MSGHQNRQAFVIGREPPADIVVAAPQVSARHATIVQLDAQTFLIKDLESMNGTFVNHERVHSSVIRPPDAVALGTVPLEWPQILACTTPQRSPEFQPATQGQPKSVVASSPAPAKKGGFLKQKKSAAPKKHQAKLVQPTPTPRFEPQPAGGAPLSKDLAAALAAQKTYGTKAFFVWFLYWLGWLPGCIMNMVYLSEANSIKRQAGVSPSGRGCLVFLFVTHVVLPLISLLVLLAIGGTAISSLF